MRRVLAVLAVLVVAAPAAAHPMPHPAKERYFAHRCTAGDMRACIHAGALHWGAPYADGRYIAWRESRFEPCVPNSEGSGALGLFQFMPRTWAYTPYRAYSRCDPLAASRAWAYMWTHGWKSAWDT